MRRRLDIAVAVLSSVMVAYAVVHALGGGEAVCASASCEALQDRSLWWAGAVYAGMFLLTHRFARKFLGLVVVVGIAVECGLVLTQVILNLYCVSCLGYTAMFVLLVFLAGPEIVPLARRVSLGLAAASLVAVLVSVVSTHNVTACSGSPFTSVRWNEQELNLLFEPTCPHCHEVIALLERKKALDRVRLCPEAWSLKSLWELVRGNCASSGADLSTVLCCARSTLAAVRENNGFCADQGYLVAPLVVHSGQVVKSEDLHAFLSARLNISGSGGMASGACRINTNTCSD